MAFLFDLVDFVEDCLGFAVVLGEHFVEVLGGRGEAVLDLHLHFFGSLDVVD